MMLTVTHLQIRTSKEEARRRKALDALIKAQEYDEGYWEGLSPEEQQSIEKQLLESNAGPVSGGVGSVGGVQRRWGATVNSTRILTDNGASFAPGQKNLADLMDLQEKAAFELRERWKQIDQHLEKVRSPRAPSHTECPTRPPLREMVHSFSF